MRRRSHLALAALAVAGFAAPAPAQIPGTAVRVTPVPLVTAVIKSPDLVVTMAPGRPFPTSFTVKNVGTAEAGISVLRVTATLLPFEGEPPGPSCSGPFSMLCAFRRQADTVYFRPDQLRAACGEPFPEFLEAVPALRAGEVRSFSRDMTRFGNLTMRLNATLGPQPGSHVKHGVTTLVCAFDVTSSADTSNQVSEIREDNNVKTLRVYREIRLE